MAQKIEYVDPDSLVIIGLDTDDRHEHPLFDERVFLPIDENLVKNIIVYGIQVPVLVRQEAGTTIVIDGRQRVRAARKAAGNANMAGEYGVKVPILPKSVDDKRVQGIMISTNELRQDDDVLSKAVKAQRLHDILGDIDEVAIAFGKSKTTIKNWLILVEADTRVHAAVKAGQISVTAAIEVSRLKREEQKPVLEALITAAGGTRVSESQAKAAVTGSEANKAQAGSGTAGQTAGSGATATTIATATTTTTTTTTKRKSGRSANQRGIKRVWLRKALETQVAKALTDDQRAVLKWFATGEALKGAWFDDFVSDAESELDGTAKPGSPGTVGFNVAPAAPEDTDEVEVPSEAMSPEDIAAELKALSESDEDVDGASL